MMLKMILGLLTNKNTWYLLIILSIAGTIWYQHSAIQSLESDVKAEQKQNRMLERKIEVIEKQSEDIEELRDLYAESQKSTVKQLKKMEENISRIEVIKAKPGLVSRMIEKSWKKSNDEAACFTGNKEACDAINSK